VSWAYGGVPNGQPIDSRIRLSSIENLAPFSPGGDWVIVEAVLIPRPKSFNGRIEMSIYSRRFPLVNRSHLPCRTRKSNLHNNSLTVFPYLTRIRTASRFLEITLGENPTTPPQSGWEGIVTGPEEYINWLAVPHALTSPIHPGVTCSDVRQDR